jgi:hypothetical protein
MSLGETAVCGTVYFVRNGHALPWPPEHDERPGAGTPGRSKPCPSIP